MVTITEMVGPEEIYRYQMRFQTPYFFPVDYESWRASFEADVDGEGRNLFRDLSVKAAYEDDRLVGFIQYGRTAFGFEDGPGSKCMTALKHWLFQKGIVRFDTDTALLNTVARHFYEKNGFTREGITRSYYKKRSEERCK